MMMMMSIMIMMVVVVSSPLVGLKKERAPAARVTCARLRPGARFDFRPDIRSAARAPLAEALLAVGGGSCCAAARSRVASARLRCLLRVVPRRRGSPCWCMHACFTVTGASVPEAWQHFVRQRPHAVLAVQAAQWYGAGGAGGAALSMRRRASFTGCPRFPTAEDSAVAEVLQPDTSPAHPRRIV